MRDGKATGGEGRLREDGGPVGAALRELHDSLRAEKGGALPTYIPELARVDPALFGLALATLDGRVYTAGDADVPFTLQSLSKPFVYARALADLGLEAVLSRV